MREESAITFRHATLFAFSSYAARYYNIIVACHTVRRPYKITNRVCPRLAPMFDHAPRCRRALFSTRDARRYASARGVLCLRRCSAICADGTLCPMYKFRPSFYATYAPPAYYVTTFACRHRSPHAARPTPPARHCCRHPAPPSECVRKHMFATPVQQGIVHEPDEEERPDNTCGIHGITSRFFCLLSSARVYC